MAAIGTPTQRSGSSTQSARASAVVRRRAVVGVLTVVSLGISIFIVNTLGSVLHGFEGQDASAQSHLWLVTRHRVSLTNFLPESYWEKIRQVPHVTAVAPWSWFGGVYKDSTWQNQFARFSTDPVSYIAVTEGERTLPEDQKKAWIEDRRGAIAHAFEPNTGKPSLRVAEATALSPETRACRAASTEDPSSRIRRALSRFV